MSLRYRLFLWIGLIFLLAFGASLFFEVQLTDKHLRKAESALREQILSINEKTRLHLEEYLATSIGEDQAQIDALLLRLSRDPSLFDGNAWANLGLLFKNNPWIDFSQGSKQGELSGLLVPLTIPMKGARQQPIDEKLSWIFVDGYPPLLGIAQSSSNSLTGKIFLIFSPTALQGRALTGDPVLDQAIGYVQNASLMIPTPPLQSLKEPGCPVTENSTVRMVEFLERADQAAMIATLAALFPTDLWGDSPFSRLAPLGVASIDMHGGKALFSQDIFFKQRFFDEVLYTRQYPAGKNCQGVSNGLAVVAPNPLKRLFIANTLSIGKSEILAVGMDLEQILKTLQITLHEALLVVHGGEAVGGYKLSGEPIEEFPFESSMLKNASGIIDWEGASTYYLHMQPLKDVDLHIYVLYPEKEAFAYVDALDTGTRKVIAALSVNMRTIAGIALLFVLLLLHRISKRITQPIKLLAEATQDVGAGKLEDIQLPKMAPSRHDEVAVLCHSFEKMIQGLKEKEKVKGVLNKVVSQEIAQEILQGKIHLGGEERNVTVLFADIRQFTQMTSHLPPQEVVGLLNMCMTKVSHVIDAHGGVIDKYVGDEVMALFGAPIDRGDSALRAIQAAWEIVEVLKQWNAERKQKGLFPVEMGIGIHTGTMLVGNMGAENRLNYTVIGRNVNLAARLCSVAKGMQIVLTEDTLKEPHVQEHVRAELLPPTALKGFEEQQTLYQVVACTQS